MARKVNPDWRHTPEDVKAILAKANHLGTTATLKILRRKKAPIVTPLLEIRKMAKRFGKKNRVKVTVSAPSRIFGSYRMPSSKKSVKHSDACSAPYNRIYLHPILQYSTKRYIGNALDHEMDHVLVDRREKESLERRGFKMVRINKNGLVTWRKN